MSAAPTRYWISLRSFLPEGSPRHGIRRSELGASRKPTAGSIRILFAFDPRREAFFLVSGDKSGNWDGWYRQAIRWPTTGSPST